MTIPELVIIIFLTHYTVYLLKLTNKKFRQRIQGTNKKLNKLRKIPVKSLEDQKKFLDIKYPKRQKKKFKFTWKWLLNILFHLALYIGFIQGYRIFFRWIGFELKFWMIIPVVFLLPIIINLILRRFNLEKSDITNYLK